MPKIDKSLAEILKKYGADPKTDIWNCRGTWVAYHRALERIATKAGITFEPPMIIEANGLEKVAAICVTGHLGDKTEWSIGEAAPQNNKNAYPWAMAEKRAKDRVILKLIGLHGLVYSEEEADDFKDARPQQAKPSSVASIAASVGAGKPKETFWVIDRFGEQVMEYSDPMEYIVALTAAVEEDATWWENNKDEVAWIGKNAPDKKIKDAARKLWKFGEALAADLKNQNQGRETNDVPHSPPTPDEPAKSRATGSPCYQMVDPASGHVVAEYHKANDFLDGLKASIKDDPAWWQVNSATCYHIVETAPGEYKEKVQKKVRAIAALAGEKEG